MEKVSIQHSKHKIFSPDQNTEEKRPATGPNTQIGTEMVNFPFLDWALELEIIYWTVQRTKMLAITDKLVTIIICTSSPLHTFFRLHHLVTSLGQRQQRCPRFA